MYRRVSCIFMIQMWVLQLNADKYRNLTYYVKNKHKNKYVW